MLPIALEWAICLERLSALAVVAICGLAISTFLTLIYVPVFYDLFESLQGAWCLPRFLRGVTRTDVVRTRGRQPA